MHAYNNKKKNIPMFKERCLTVCNKRVMQEFVLVVVGQIFALFYVTSCKYAYSRFTINYP